VISDSARIENGAHVHESVQVWHRAHVRERVVIDANSIIGSDVYLGPGVQVGSDCKIQNAAQVYQPAQLGRGVFIGPGVILTNDRAPRAVTPRFERKTVSDWQEEGVVVQDGASIGASAVCVAPLTIGKWAMVGAGAVVIQDVPDFALVVGTPARQIGWVGRAGIRLIPDELELNQWVCPSTSDIYVLKAGFQMSLLREVTGEYPA
jgi:UDP-2-acetamido-3-amino-2,3-dideoxy-glucuronate N-acetyltransferase